MIPIDLRSIFFSYMLTNFVSLIVMIILWRQSRKRFKGTNFLVADFIFQLLCVVLILLRGHVPDFLSMVVSNTLAVAGAILGLIGLEYFTGKKSSQFHNYLLIGVFFGIHTYFTFVIPNLEIRNLNTSLATLIIFSQCAWLLVKRVPASLRNITLNVGIVFALFSMVNSIRVIEFFVHSHIATDYFHAGSFETFVIISYQLLFIFLTFSLGLMINKRLLKEIATQEEKFSKGFHSVPYAIIITKYSDGKLIEVNEGFENITHFTTAEVIGKTTIELKFWANEFDREMLIRTIAEKGKVKELEVGFRKKTGELFSGLISSEIIIINNEKCIISVINNITEQKLAGEMLRKSEEKFKSLFAQMSEGFALHEVVYDESHNAIDYRIIDINPAFEKQVGITANKANGALASELYGVSPAPFLEIYAHVALTGEPQTFQSYFPPLDKHYDISVFSPNPGFFATIFTDITERKQVEETLKQSEAKFKNLVIDMQVGVLLQGPQSEILMSNPKALELLGISEDQLLGKTSFDPDWNVIHEDGSPFPGSTHPVPEAIATNKSVHDVIMGVYRPSEGDRVWLKVDAELQFNNDGSVGQVVCSFIDITKRKQAEQAQLETNAYLENLINYANAPIIVWDPQFRITRFNHAFEFITGRSETEVRGQSLSILFPPAQAENSMALIRKTLTGERWETVEIEIIHLENSVRTILWNTATIFSPDDKTPLATIAQGQDITERKKAENEIKQKNEELQKLNTEKDKFFSIIAHDLKSPFNSFLGYTELMVDELDNMSLKQIQAIAVDMKRSANYLYGLLENLLYWSRIQRGISGFDPSTFLLKPKIEDSINAVIELANKKGIAITMMIPDDIQVFADANMLESIIRNLTTNAVKFTPKGGGVKINVKAAGNNQVEISVTDTGIGMDKEMVAKLFQLDEQTSRKGTDGEPSTGLGLIICKDFIEKHGGSIWVESIEDEGSTFYFTRLLLFRFK